MNNQKTGTLIAETRKDLNLTQKDLAENLHVSIQAVSKWERGLSFPDVLLLEPLAELLSLSVSELLAGERKTPTQEQPVPEHPTQEQLVPERLVQESIRISTAQLGSRIKKWRKRFLSTAALLCAFLLLLGGFYLYRHTKLLPRNETSLSQQEPSAEALATAVAFGGDVVLYDLVYADNITGESLQLELWTPEGLAKTWPLFAARGDDPRTRPRHETIALSAGVDFGRDGAPDTFRYGAALHSGIVHGTLTDIPYLSAGFSSIFLEERVEVHPEYGVVLACFNLDTTMQGQWRTAPCLGAVEKPTVPEGQATLLVRLTYEYE